MSRTPHGWRLAFAIYVPLAIAGVLWSVLESSVPGDNLDFGEGAAAWIFVAILLATGVTVHLNLRAWHARRLRRLVNAIEQLAYVGMRARNVPSAAELGPLSPVLRRLADHVAAQENDLVRTRDEAWRAAEKASQATEAKSAFFAQISHEIRTPMTSILGFSDVITDAATSTEERIAHGHTIRSNSEHLLHLINDLLDLAKVEAGHMSVERVQFSPHETINDILELFEERVTRKGIQLTAEFPEPLPQVICSDPTRFRQILTNLVGNAIKFTEVGGVKLTTRLQRSARNQTQLRIDIVDSGIGMTRAEASGVFKAFTQASSTTTRTHGGTGLGLCIAKQLAELLGGGITVQSAKGRGTLFSVAISTGPIVGVPLVRGAQTSMRTETSAASSVALRGRVLVAEDTPDVRHLITLTLEGCGVEVTGVENGRLAADRALESMRDENPYDVILMDLHMPEMNGDEAVRILRAEGYTGQIIALTAHAGGPDLQRILSAGCNDYFTKPFRRDELIHHLTRYLSVKARERRDEKSSATISVELPVAHPPDGPEEPESEADVMIEDAALEENATERAVTEQAVVEEAIVEEIAIEEVIAEDAFALIDDGLEITSDLDIEFSAAEVDDTPAEAAHEEPMDDPDGVLLSAFENDPEMAELVVEFLKFLPGQIDSLEEFISSGDLTALRASAHQLRGSAGTFGYDVISESATNLERAVRDGHESSEIEDYCMELLHLCRRAMLAVEFTE